MDKIKISKEEWMEISNSLEEHHAVFYKLWHMGKPVFNEDLPTAAVQFDEIGELIPDVTWVLENQTCDT